MGLFKSREQKAIEEYTRWYWRRVQETEPDSRRDYPEEPTIRRLRRVHGAAMNAARTAGFAKFRVDLQNNDMDDLLWPQLWARYGDK
jgi:hypothetical protein